PRRSPRSAAWRAGWRATPIGCSPRSRSRSRPRRAGCCSGWSPPRARGRAEAELLSPGAERHDERAALEALVRGRIVVANDAQRGAYELAHEALLVSWSTLQGWLQSGAAERAVRARVE